MPDESPVLDPSITTFGGLLRYLRQRAGLTQQQFGLAVGYSHAHVARLEGGKRLPDVTAVQSLFVEALGLQPGSELATQLVERANTAREDAASEPGATAELVQEYPRQGTSNNLPVQATSFIGRERELSELHRLLGGTRLLTLTGSGGTGKTRLALRLAADVAGTVAYPNGVWLVELASVTDPAFVSRAIAAVLGVREESSCPLEATLLEYLNGKQLLLLLDNCEHLIDACARFADGVLRGSEGPRILATSREGLGIAGELTWPVPSLQTPGARDIINLAELAQYEAVRLFMARAVFAFPAFVLTAANAAAVRQICTRLDGIPLAIELAAAQLHALSAEQIVQRLNDRFRLLTGGSRTALPRQQTLRGTIDWSYSLLTEAERGLFRRLSVFVGSWTLEAAEAVTSDDQLLPSDILSLHANLVNKSLVVVDERGDDTRYHLLETIRQYAREKLVDTLDGEGARARNQHLHHFVKLVDVLDGEGARARNRHLNHFVKLGEEMRPLIFGTVRGDQINLVKRLEPDLDNVCAALDWANETGQVDDGLRLASLWPYIWAERGRLAELMERLQLLLAQPMPVRNTRNRARALLALAELYQRQSDFEKAQSAVKKALAIGLALHEPEIQRDSYFTLVFISIARSAYALARSYAVKWQAIAETLLDKPTLEGHVALVQGEFALNQGDYKQAQRWLTVWTDFLHESGNRLASTSFDRFLGYALLYQGDDAGAGLKFRQSLIDNAAVGDGVGTAACLAAFAALALARADRHQAARLFGASEALSDSIHSPLLPWDTRQYRRNLAALREQLDEATLNAVRAEGRAMSMQQVIDLALALVT